MSIDIACTAVFILGFWHGYSRGIIYTLFNIFTWLFGIALAFKMAPVTRNLLGNIVNSDSDLMIILAFGINMAFVLFLMKMAARSIEGFMNFAFLSLFNRAAGGVATGGFYVLIFSVLLYFVNMANALNPDTLAESRTLPYLQTMPPKVWAMAKRFQPMAKEFMNNSYDWMDRLEEEGVQRTESKQKTYRPPENGAGVETEPREAPRPRRVGDESSGIED